MQTLNLVHVDKSDIKYHIDTFPDGEKSLVIDSNIDHKTDLVNIVTRLSSMDEIFIMLQAADILNRHGVVFDLYISYLMSMRMDRVMDFNRPFSLRVVTNMIKNCGARNKYVIEPHSDRTLEELGAKQWVTQFNLIRNNSVFNLIRDNSIKSRIDDLKGSALIFPDVGAKKRYSHTSGTIICFNKKRDLSTGKIIELVPETKDDFNAITLNYDFLLIDDLCDGGGTFVGIANKVREINKNARLSILVTHLVNDKGLENLSNNFDEVFITNSYKDWNLIDNLPRNIKVIDVV